MLGENPELLNLFSRSAQATGEQRRALAGAIAAYGAHLIGEAPSFDSIASRIAHRHAALGIRPEQYTLVGKYLMRAIVDVLGDAVTPQVGDGLGRGLLAVRDPPHRPGGQALRRGRRGRHRAVAFLHRRATPGGG
jgi:hemoglobin-like flavoprotein